MRWLISLLLVLLTLPGLAQTPADPDKDRKAPAAPVNEPDHEAHEALRAMRDQAVAAVNKSDLDGLLGVCDDQICFTAMNNEVCHGKPEVKAYFEKMMVGPQKVVDRMQLTNVEVDRLTTLYEGTAGVASGTCTGEYKLTGGMEFKVTNRWTATAVKTPDGWKIAAIQFGTNMFENPLLDVARKGISYAAVTAGVVGLLVGFLVGALVGRWGKRP